MSDDQETKPLPEEAVPAPDQNDQGEQHDEEEERRDLIAAFVGLGTDLETAIRALKPSAVAKDLRTVEPRLFIRYFRGFRPDKIGRSRVAHVLGREIRERENTRVMQLVSLLWNHSHQKVYRAMRDLVATIDADVEKVKRIEDTQAAAFLESLQQKGFDRAEIHTCVRLNGVRFSPDFVASHLAPKAETAGTSA